MRLYFEMLLLFVGIPASFLLPVPPFIKLGVGVIGFVYLLWVSIKIEKLSFKSLFKNRTIDWKTIALRFVIIAIGSFLFKYFFEPEDLFNVVQNNWKIWLIFMGVYIVFSVLPQEFIYRTFFFHRYEKLVQSKWAFILLNTLLFSFAHIWFKSLVVLSFTFIGGVLFALTYKKSRSFVAVCVEHTLYGNWLYTVGFGETFMFPIN